MQKHHDPRPGGGRGVDSTSRRVISTNGHMEHPGRRGEKEQQPRNVSQHRDARQEAATTSGNEGQVRARKITRKMTRKRHG